MAGAAGSNFTVVLVEDGNALSFGRNTRGD